MADKHVIEEVLEFIWYQRERGMNSVESILAFDEVRASGATVETLNDMEAEGLVKITGEMVFFTDAGEVAGESVIRRHRLAEMLLSEILEVRGGDLERNACTFEHTLSPTVADSICTLLGHPPACPHGHPIPRGECCKATAETLCAIVRPLHDLDVGDPARIIFIAPGSDARLDRLGSMGLVPGSNIKLHQKNPSFVVEIGKTTLAIEASIAREIFVKKTT